MIMKEFYSTGEAAKILNISRSTVSRRFDLGLLTGKKNPITGERFVARESIDALLKLYNVSTGTPGMGRKKVFVLTADPHLFEFLRQTFLGDEHLQMERVLPGADVLKRCLQEHPDLLIIDAGSPDHPGSEVIRALREVKEPLNLKILCLSSSQDLSKTAAGEVDETWVKETVLNAGFKKRLFVLLGLEAEAAGGEEGFEHHRRWPRVAVGLPAKIWLYRLRTPYLRDPGEAVVENISCGGALLSKIQLEKGGIPCEPFRIFMKIDQSPLRNWNAHCKVVRLQSNGGPPSAGVQFIRLSKSHFRLIESMTQP